VYMSCVTTAILAVPSCVSGDCKVTRCSCGKIKKNITTIPSQRYLYNSHLFSYVIGDDTAVAKVAMTSNVRLFPPVESQVLSLITIICNFIDNSIDMFAFVGALRYGFAL
jgi:hypothetical protein